MNSMQIAGILPGWMVTIPIIIIVCLLTWAFVAGGTRDLCQYCNDDGDPCPRCGRGTSHGLGDFTDDDGYVMSAPIVVEEPRFSTEAPLLAGDDPTANDLREVVIALWNECGGWIPGAAYADLAFVLGVDVKRLTHYDPTTKTRHVGGPA